MKLKPFKNEEYANFADPKMYKKQLDALKFVQKKKVNLKKR